MFIKSEGNKDERMEYKNKMPSNLGTRNSEQFDNDLIP